MLAECARAIAVATKALDKNPKLKELLAKYPGLDKTKVLPDKKQEDLREAIYDFREAKRIMESQIAQRTRPGFMYIPTQLSMMKMAAQSMQGMQQHLSKRMGAVVEADLKAGYAVYHF